MQLKLVLTLTIVVACFLQVSNAFTVIYPTTTEVHHGIIDNLVEKAKDAIAKVTNLMTDSVASAVENLGKLKDKAEQLAKNAIVEVKNQLENIVNKTKEGFKGILNKAKDLSIDVGICLGESNKQFKNLVGQLLANEVKCVTDEINKIISKIKESITIIKNSIKNVIQLPGKLKNCTEGQSKISCIAGVILETAKIQSSLPKIIVDAVEEVSEIMGGLEIKLAICGATQIAKAGMQTALVVAKFGKCTISRGVN